MTMHHARVAQIEDLSVRRAGSRGKAEALPALSEAIVALGSALAFAFRTVGRRRQMRQDLLSMNDDQLRDVGMSRDEALRAAERIEWRGDWK